MQRVKRALGGFEEVKDIKFLGSEENFQVIYQADRFMAEEMHKAVEEVVVAPGARKFLGDLGGNKQLPPH